MRNCANGHIRIRGNAQIGKKLYSLLGGKGDKVGVVMAIKRKTPFDDLLLSEGELIVTGSYGFRVYALVNVEKEQVFYIGCTGSTLKRRYINHIQAAKHKGKRGNGSVQKEIRRILSSGGRVQIQLHATLPTLGEALAVEEALINTYVADELTNVQSSATATTERVLERVNRKRRNKLTADELKRYARNGTALPSDG